VVSAVARTGTGVHALLLYGPDDAARLALGRALALAWLCPGAGPEGACLECGVCQSFANGRAVDYQEIHPYGASAWIPDAEIAGGGGTARKSRFVPVIDFFRVGPLAARHKVVLLHRADRMSPAAANGLLKTLEEPAPFARLILTTSRAGAILPTVMSRCLAVACDLPAAGALSGRSEAERVFCEGAPGLADRIAAHLRPYERLLSFLDGLPAMPRGAALRASERFRGLAEGFEDLFEDGAERAANGEALRALGAWLAARHPLLIEARLATAEAHRRVLGNASMQAQCDWLFAMLLSTWG
jgi:DNA polymerase-3 subunit delta'